MATQQEIVAIYNRRPQSMKALRLGQWFMNAHGIDGDSVIYNCSAHSRIFSLMEQRGWLTYDTVPLVEYNRSHQ